MSSIKDIKNENIPVSLVSTETKVKSPVSQNLSSVPVGQKSIDEARLALLKKHNLNLEEYAKLILECPDFDTLSETEQIQKVNEFLGIKPDDVPVAETKKTDAVKTLGVPDKSPEPDIVNSDESSINYSAKNKFDALDTKNNYAEKKQILIDEAIRNDFLYGEPKHTEKEWNALLKDKTKYNDLVKTKIAPFENAIKEAEKTTGNKTKSFVLDSVMRDVQTANRLKISVEELNSRDTKEPGQKAEAIYDYLEELSFGTEDGKTQMSFSDRFEYNEYKTQIEVANYSASKNGKNVSNMCIGDAQRYLKENNINPIVARYEYLTDVNNGKVDTSAYGEDYKAKISKEYNLYKDVFKDLDKDSIKNLLSNVEKNGEGSEPAPIIRELLSDEKAAKAYKYADSPKAKAVILSEYLKNNYGKNVDKEQFISELQEMKNQALASGDIETAMVLQGYANHNKAYAKKLANSEKINDQVTNSVDMASLGEYAPDAISKMETGGNPDLLIESQHTLGEEQKVKASKSYLSSKFSDVRLGVANVVAVGANDENQRKISDLTISEEYEDKTDVRNSLLKNVGNMHSSNKCYIFDSQTADKNAVLLNTASTVYCDLNKEDQVWGAQTTRERSAELSETERNSIELNIANTIVKADKENQVELHKYMCDSEFDSVQEQLGKNINLYHKDNQTEAYNITMKSGNERAIEAAVSQYDKMDAKAQAATQDSYEAESAKIEAKYTEQVASDYAKSKDIQGKGEITKPELTQEERIEQAKEKFVNASPQEKYAMLSQILDKGIQKDVFQKLVKYCPTILLAMMDLLVANGQGQAILNTLGKSSEVTYKVVHLMMTRGKGSDKKIAAKYVLDSPSQFSKSTVEKATKVMDEMYGVTDRNNTRKKDNVTPPIINQKRNKPLLLKA